MSGKVGNVGSADPNKFINRVVKVFRGSKDKGELKEYNMKQYPGMVVLDAIHQIQAEQQPDLAVRWNCKAGKCGSCSAEVNGKPKLMCMCRMEEFPEGETITVRPLKTFPVIRDLVADVSWNYEVNKKIPPFKPKPKEADGTWRMQQYEVDRVQEFRKCIECFLCQNTCHVLRDHDKKKGFGGPRFFIRAASLEMHPLDTDSRIGMIKDELGVGLCNINKCCTEVCPEEIKITDNGIIPLKERLVSHAYDPIVWLWNKVTGKKAPAEPRV